MNYIYRVSKKGETPLWYQNIAVLKTFLGTSLTECDENHQSLIFLAYLADLTAILAIYRSFYEAFPKIGCFRAKISRIQKCPNSSLVMA